MIVFPSMLVGPAEAAGIQVPPDPENYSKEDFPHWHVYVTLQCGRRMPSPISHWENATVVAQCSEDDLKTATVQDFERMGFQ